MNSTTTPPLISPAVEVRGATLTAYLSAMGMVVLQYDVFLTLKDEVRLVWPGGLSLPKALYYLNRYLSFFVMIFCNYEVSGLRPAISDNLCRRWIVVSGTALPIATLASTALLTLRVTALYRRVRWFTPSIWVAFALFQGLRTTMMFYIMSALYASLKYSPVSNVCIPIDTKYRSAVPLLIPGIFDFLLLSLTLVKGIKTAISLRTGSGPNIMYALIRDEILVFSTISSLRIFNSVALMLLPPSLLAVGIYAEWGLEATLTSRFFLNLRAIALHQQVTTFDTQAVPSTLPTRRSWKRQGPITTDFFIGLDTDRTTHPNLSKGGTTQQTETLDLKEMKSPTQEDQGDMTWRG